MPIDKWKELNKDWLCNFSHYPASPFWMESWRVNGREHEPSIGDMWYADLDEELILCLGHKRTLDIGIKGDYFGVLLKYFRDWKRPTQQEKDMYEMLTGVKIMWSEESPFKTLEDE